METRQVDEDQVGEDQGGEDQGGEDQARLWNGSAGRGWVEAQQLLDTLYQPFEDLLVEAVRTASSRRILDVGCGTGSTTLAIARRLQPSGRCLGIDVSVPMVAAAQARAEREGTQADFLCADAQRHAFAPGSFDMIVSRFGVMFFDDAVCAFANLRRAAAVDATLRCIAWRSAAENPFMTAAEHAAAPLLPSLPARRPDAPGQFAFADPQRVRVILEESGWTEVDIQPIDVACTFPEASLGFYLTRLGPVGRVLQDADERTRAQVVDILRAAFGPYVHGAEVRFTAACWNVGARASRESTGSQVTPVW